MKIYLATFCFALAIIGCTIDTSEIVANGFLIKNVVIVSPERDVPSELTNVLVREGRIAAIGREIAQSAHESDQVIDGAGRYLTPGLIDAHTHLSDIPGMTDGHENDYPNIARDARRQIPRSYLYYGFTTVIDLASPPGVVEQWNKQDVRPHAYFCGPAPVFDGYPMNFIPKSVRYRVAPYFLFDEARADEFPGKYDPEEHMPQAVVAKMHDDGAICVKTFFEPGFGLQDDLPLPTKEMMRDLVTAANEQGMPVLLHANSQSAQAFGVETGVDGLAHGMWNWDERPAARLNPEVTLILDAIIERNIVWQPTMQVLYGERDLHNPDYLAGSELQDVLPQSLIDWYKTDDGRWFRNRMLDNPRVARVVESGHWEELGDAPIAGVTAALSYLASNGGRLSFGTDTPSSPTYANPPGLNGFMEMQRWLDAGVTPAQLFRAATIANAEFFGLQEEIGTVEEGKRADLLLMTKNPMNDVSAFDAIDVVILGGRVFPRSELSAKNTQQN